MKIFRLCALLSVSIVLTATPTNVVKSCAGGDEELTNPSYFFDQTIIGPTPYAPLFYTPRSLYTQEWYSDSALIRENVDDWIAGSEHKPLADDVEFVVYKSNIRFLAQAREYVASSMDMMSDSLRLKLEGNTLIQYWKQRKALSSIDYVLFAKACEPYATDEYLKWAWSEERGDYDRLKPSAIPAMDSLILVGRSRIQKDLPAFLKVRYGYQLVRLAHYAGQYGRCIGLYDTLVASVTSNSPIKLWALANKAGAQRALGMEAEAAHNFSNVFARDEGRRLLSIV